MWLWSEVGPQEVEVPSTPGANQVVGTGALIEVEPMFETLPVAPLGRQLAVGVGDFAWVLGSMLL